MTPTERRDMPWLLGGFALVIVVLIVGAASRWS